MNRIYVLGAGASRGYSGSKTGFRPPLAGDLLSTFNRLDQNITVLSGKTMNYLMDRKGETPPALDLSDWEIDAEAFLSEIGDKIQQKANRDGPDQSFEVMRLISVYTELVYLLTWTLNEIQNGDTCNTYRKFVSHCSPQDTVITLNWDTLLDKALTESGRWYPDDGYGMTFDAIHEGEWRRPQTSQSEIQLLKLHGSTNWIIPAIVYRFDVIIDQHDPEIEWEPVPVSCYVSSDGEYVTYQERWIGGYEPFSYCYYPPNLPMDIPEAGPINISKHALSIPLIVPPLKQKPYGLFKGLIDHLWHRASSAMCEASELALVGYSLPPTDIRPLDLIRIAAEFGRLRRIMVINPDPSEVAERVRDTTGRKVTVDELPMTFDEFLDEER